MSAHAETIVSSMGTERPSAQLEVPHTRPQELPAAPSTPGAGAGESLSTTRTTRGSARSGTTSLPGSAERPSRNASKSNPFARGARGRPSLPNPTTDALPSPRPSDTPEVEPPFSTLDEAGPSGHHPIGTWYSQDEPAGVSSSAPLLHGAEGPSDPSSSGAGSDRVLPYPVALAGINGSAGLDVLSASILGRTRGDISGASTPLSSPPANEPSPPLFLPSKMTTLIAQAPVAPTVVLSLPPSSVPESPKPFTAAQKGKGKASAASEPRMVRARRSTASMGVAVGMGGMGGVGERKEIEELVRECRDRMATPGMTDGTDLPPILLTTLSLLDINPQPTIYDPNAASTSTSTSTTLTTTSSILPAPSAPSQSQIETPSFRLVDPKEDEARSSGRLRKRATAEEADETSDAHYHALHKKYETFEKRQRRREKERLLHERYKMKERVDLIRTMDGRSFAALVASGEQPPEDGTIKRVVHPEEIRTKMLEEAEEVLKRYDVLVGPTDRMKQKRLEDLNADDSGSDATTPPPSSSHSFTRTSSSLRPPTSSSHPNGKSPTLIKLRLPPSSAAQSPANSTHSSALPFHPSSSTSKPAPRGGRTERKSKRVRISAYDEQSSSSSSSEEEKGFGSEADDVVSEEEETRRRPASRPRRSSLLPAAQAAQEAPVEYDEFAFWPRAPVGGMPMLEKTAERHMETVTKQLDELAKELVRLEAEAKEEANGQPMEIDGAVVPKEEQDISTPAVTTRATRGHPSAQVEETQLKAVEVAPPPLETADPAQQPQPDGPPPAKKARREKKPLTKTLAGARSARFNTPWGIKIPDVVGWKNEFDLDGEFWLPLLSERNDARVARAEAADALGALASFGAGPTPALETTQTEAAGDGGEGDAVMQEG